MRKLIVFLVVAILLGYFHGLEERRKKLSMLEKEGDELFKKGDHARSLERLLEALEMAKTLEGPESEKVAEIYGNIGFQSACMEEWGKAEEFSRKGLEIAEKGKFPKVPLVTTCISNLGFAAMGRKDYPTALRHYEAALRLAVGELGPDAVYVASRLMNVANIHSELGDFKKEIQCRKEALRIILMHPNTPGKYVAGAYEGLGKAQKKAGNLQEAKDSLEKALSLVGFPKHSPAGAAGEGSAPRAIIELQVEILKTLGEVNLEQGERVQAQDLLQKAVDLASNSLGLDHQTTKKCLAAMKTLEEK